MNTLSAGFSRVNITPMMGIGMAGYFFPRFADGVLDELEVNALALRCGEDTAVLLTVDNCGIQRDIIEDFSAHIQKKTGLSRESILIHATHSHTAPGIIDPYAPITITQNYVSVSPELEMEYYNFLRRKLADAARLALDDLKPAKMGWGIGQAPNIAYIRRYRMKDGSVQTNPGIDNPNIDHPLGDVDERVSVLRFDREGADSLVLVNFADHPDSVGGSKISADWPGFVRRTVEKTLDGTQCIFFNGAEGDVNHVNVHPTGGYMNDQVLHFDGPRGYKHSRYLGRVITAGVLQAFDKVQYVDVDSVKCIQRTIRVASNMPTPQQIPEAERIHKIHEAGKDEQLPYEGMMLTTVVAEAERMVKLKDGPESFEMELSAVAIGPVALIGLPGEPFTGIGRALKLTEGWDLVIPCCLTNGSQGYFPMQDAYDEGGYESRSSFFKAGVAEFMIREGTQVLQDLQGSNCL